MDRDARGPSREGGFTLIEVLIAMVILAVGLFSLEALGIAAARSVARAQRQSESAQIASAYLEATVTKIRRDATSTVSSVPCVTEAKQHGQYLVEHTVTGGPQRRTVTVRVTSTANAGGAVPQPFSVTSSVFVANAASC